MSATARALYLTPNSSPSNLERVTVSLSPTNVEEANNFSPTASLKGYNGTSDIIFETKLSIESYRMEKIRKYRSLFGIATVIFACFTMASLVLHWNYEPFVALSFSTLGIFVVFAMKVHEGKT